MSLTRKFVVLGGAGTIGRVVVRDLFASHRANHILIADFNEAAARRAARRYRSRRVRAGFAAAQRTAALVRLLRGHAVVINCTQHNFNLDVMRAALRARVHYIDLGGLFYWTRRQLRFHRAFARAGLTAVLGMGCAPGISNVMARALAGSFQRVDAVKIRVGTIDPDAPPGEFYFPYSAQTIVEEFTLAPWVFTGGRCRQVRPRSGWERVQFPAPVGAVWTVRTRHSEVATLPRSLGARFCDFKVGFDRVFVREVVRRLRAGWTVPDFARLPVPRRTRRDAEVTRVEVTGLVRGGRGRCRRVLDSLAVAKPQWQASAGDVDTGCPPSIVAQMIVTGRVTAPGVWPPERVVPVTDFFRELQRRELHVTAKY